MTEYIETEEHAPAADQEVEDYFEYRFATDSYILDEQEVSR